MRVARLDLGRVPRHRPARRARRRAGGRARAARRPCAPAPRPGRRSTSSPTVVAASASCGRRSRGRADPTLRALGRRVARGHEPRDLGVDRRVSRPSCCGSQRVAGVEDPPPRGRARRRVARERRGVRALRPRLRGGPVAGPARRGPARRRRRRRLTRGRRAGPRGGRPPRGEAAARRARRRAPGAAPPAAVDGRRPSSRRASSRCSACSAQGLTNGQIGKQLYISTKTVSVHVSNLLAKLGASGRTEAAAIARRRGLVRPDPLEVTSGRSAAKGRRAPSRGAR